MTLKDELKGLFDDRRMAVRMEQRTTEGKVSLHSPPATELGANASIRSKSSTTKLPSISTPTHEVMSKAYDGWSLGVL